MTFAEENIPDNENNAAAAPPVSEEAPMGSPSLPADAAEWRSLLTSLPPRELFRLVQSDKGRSARVFTGLRPNPEMLRHPAVLSRLVQEALRQPKFAGEAAALAPVASEESSEALPPPKVVIPVKPTTVDTEGVVESLKDTLKKQRATLKDKDGEITTLKGQLATLLKERDAVQAAAEAERSARKAAESEAERQRRQRERAERREAATPRKETTVRAASPAIMPLPAASSEPLLEEALSRLLNRGKYALVTEVCREALLPEGSAAQRGTILALYAVALYGQGNISQAEEQDRLAVGALLDAGRIPEAARAMARLLTQGAGPRTVTDAPLLRRLLLLAERVGQSREVRDIFQHMHIGSPEAGKRLRALQAGLGKKEAFLMADAVASGTGLITIPGPDEAVALPTNYPPAAYVTPRAVVQAVDSGNASYVTAVRAALDKLRRDEDLADRTRADTLLKAVAELGPASVQPLLPGQPAGRPVLVDASNVARSDPDPLSLSPIPHVERLRQMQDFLLRRGFFPVLMFADANLRYFVDDRAAYMALVERGIVRETPPGTSADEVLLKEARALKAPIVTNDRLADWAERSEGIERLGFLVTPGYVALTGSI